MKILLLTTHMNLGGIGMYVLLLAKGLTKCGHKVFVASSGGDLVGSLEACGAEHIKIDIKTKSIVNPKVFHAYSEILRIIKQNKIEIIHAHTRILQVVANFISNKLNIPYVTTCHGFFKPKLLRKILPCWGDHAVAISEAVREHLVNDLGISKEKISVVHNGIEVNKFSANNFTQEQRDNFKKDFGLSLDRPVIGTIARLSSVKGQRYLIAAMPKILKRVPSAQLLLIGDGPEKEPLRKQVGDLGLKENVFFGDSTFDTSVPLSIMDLFAFPSVMEGLGLAIIEAQAMGLAVVASDVGGIYTLVKDGLNGILISPSDPQALADALIRLLRDRQLAFEMGQRAQKQVLEKFNLEQMTKGIERVYKTVALKGLSPKGTVPSHN